ncbi:MAG: acyltransferase family protein [Chloroflexi bacterium]|nr:acyltransferase family protein [Chloroflexota bacterium]
MKKSETLWIDFIRVVAIFSVVWLHSAAPLLYKYNEIPHMDWWAGNVYDSIVRMCVPLLFMISGYLLLGRQEPLKIYAVKRINKVVVPLIIWTIFYVFWRYYETGRFIALKNVFGLLLNPAYYHLWFLYTLIGLYLYIPILRVLIQHASKEILYYFIALWFIAVSVFPLIFRLSHIGSSYDLKMISGYVGYLVIGHLLGNLQINKKWFIGSFIGIFVFAVITMAGTFFLTVRYEGVYDEYFYSYLSPNVILLSISAFVSIKYLADKIITSERGEAFLGLLSSVSFGIYFVHPMVLAAIGRGWLGIPFDVFSISAIYSVPLLALLTFGISFVITFILQRIPIVRKSVP